MVNNRLALRLGLRVLAVTAAVMLLAGGALIGYSWNREWGQINTARTDLVQVRVPVITTTVWDLSRRRMQEELDALVTLPHLAWCELRLPRYTVSAGDSSGLEAIVDTFSLVHPLGGRIGVLETRFDRASVEASVREEALALLALLALVVCVLAAAILVLFRFMVTRNLEALARHARALTLDSLDEAFRLPRGDRPGRADELDNLLSAFNQMRSSLAEQITSRHEAEHSSRRHQQDYREIFNATADALVIHDPVDGRMLDVNQALLSLFGLTREELVDQPLSRLLGTDQEWGAVPGLEKIHAAAAGSIQRFEWQARPRENQPLILEVILRPAVIGGQVRVISSSRDLTERRSLEARLGHTSRMESLGQLAGGVAHDFNNLLTGIMGACELLQGRPGLQDPEARDYLALILQTSDRAADLVRKLLSFSRKGRIVNAPVDVHAVICSAVALLERSLQRTVELRMALGAGRFCVLGDTAELQNMLINLGINAGHAMPGGGVLTIRTRECRLDEAHCAAGPFENQPGDYLEIEVEDTGCGIPPELQHKVFEPFFTTRAPGEGSGLGLAAVYGTVVSHRGELALESEPGRGTVFTLRLPLCEDTVDSSVEAAGPERGSGSLLLVDDEEVIRGPLAVYLEQLGYRVTYASHGQEALELFRRQPGSYDLVLLDLVMPVMDGPTCLSHLREIDPGVRVLLASGFMPGQDPGALERQGALGFIRKPYRFAELSRLLAGLLRGRRHPSRPMGSPAGGIARE